jgi:hypothetical protein
MKNTKTILIAIMIFAGYALNAQVAVNKDGSSGNASAILDVKGTDGGMLVPRMTATEMGNIASPATGLMVFNTTENSFYYWNGSTWTAINAGGGNWVETADSLMRIVGTDTIMTITNSGDIGIGNTNPKAGPGYDRTFHIGGANVSQFEVAGNTPSVVQAQISASTVGGVLQLYTAEQPTPIERIRFDAYTASFINPFGNAGLGLGTSIVDYKLDVIGPRSQVHFGNDRDIGGWLGSFTPSNAGIAGGLMYTGTNFIAKATESELLNMVGGTIGFYSNTGLTPETTFQPLIRMAIDEEGRVGINKPIAAIEPTAALEVVSTDKGFLMPRMSSFDLLSISSPASGLQVFNVDDETVYVYVAGTNEWRPLLYGTSGLSFAAYTIGTGGSCNNTTVTGSYATMDPVTAQEFVTLDADVTVTGVYSINTSMVNGYSFSGSGTFTGTGTQQVTLYATGTPLVAQIDAFTATGIGGSCTFQVTVEEVATIYNPTTGKYWMDRNLGASRRALSTNDGEAFGHLFQFERAAEGHEVRDSPITGWVANNPYPAPSQGWYGKFIINGNGDWYQGHTNGSWSGTGGTNPCPSGFRVPSSTEWAAEMATWPTQDAAGAFASLKLTKAGYRSYSSGVVSNVNTYGYYWSGSVVNWGFKGAARRFDDSSAAYGEYQPAYGFSVRCIKN